MKKTLSFFAAALLLASTGAFAAGKTTKADVKAQIKAKSAAAVTNSLAGLRGLTIGSECKAKFDAAVKAAEAEKTACMNVDNPPAGSPIAEFNAFSQLQHDQFCGDLSNGDCADKVIKNQALFCAKDAAREEAKAKAIQKNCDAAVKACKDATKAVATNTAAIAKIEADLAAAKGATAGLKAAADDACKKSAEATK